MNLFPDYFEFIFDLFLISVIMIAVIDYGAGNLRSITNACRFIEYGTELTKSPEDLNGANKIILPGVGNFGDAMEKLEPFRKIILEKIDDGVPFLGICLGIQLVLEESEEATGTRGLCIFKGKCSRFQGVKVPHMGWNNIKIKNKDAAILKGIGDEFFYFVHSYYPKPDDESIIAATTGYGIEFPSVIARDNAFACQFHPEKSGDAGLKLLKNFLKHETD